MNNEEIVQEINDMEKDLKAIKKSIFQYCWYMRGGISLSEAWELSPDERTIINDIIDNNLKITKETRLPFF